jgi:hypothetical protein
MVLVKYDNITSWAPLTHMSFQAFPLFVLERERDGCESGFMRDALRVLRVDVSALRVIKEADILNAELNRERLVKN